MARAEESRPLLVSTDGGKSSIIIAAMGLVSISGCAMGFVEQARC